MVIHHCMGGGAILVKPEYNSTGTTDLYAFVEHWDFASPTLDPKCSKTPPKASGMHPIVVLG